MAAALHDSAVVDHADLVGLGDRRQAVGDDNGRPPFTQGVQRLLDRLLGLRIEGGRRLVEQDDRRILEKRSSDSDALAMGDFALAAFIPFAAAPK